MDSHTRLKLVFGALLLLLVVVRMAFAPVGTTASAQAARSPGGGGSPDRPLEAGVGLPTAR